MPSTGSRQVVSSFNQDRDPIAAAITSLDSGTASLADLLTQARPPLSGTVDQLNRLAPLLVRGQGRSRRRASRRMPGNYRKLARLGAYGSFIQYYICGYHVASHRPAGPDRGVPLDQARRREGARSPMLKYRGSKLIKAGFIGTVLICSSSPSGCSPSG